MRELNVSELNMVAGGGPRCGSEGGGGGGNDIGGIGDPSSFGDYMIGVYEGLVQVTSHIIERVALAFG